MTCGSKQQWDLRSGQKRRAPSRGFSLIEMVIVVAVGMITTAIAIPIVQSSWRYFTLRAAVSSFTGAIQSTRYQAIFHGCTYTIAFNAGAYNYQISSSAPAAGAGACLAAPVAVGNPIPLAGGVGAGVTLNANVNFTFSASGTVTPAAGNPAAITLTQANVAAPETITVSNNGKITVTP
jgi:prepilin-type N-terminal cleavage/methylation domain-containing protein